MIESALRHLERVRWVAAAALASVALTFVIVQAEQARVRTAVNQSREISRLVREVGGLAVDRETGIRGYRLTRNPLFLEPELAARGSLVTKFDSLRTRAANDPAHDRPVAALVSAMDDWSRAYAEPILAAVGAEEVPGTLPTEAEGKRRFDEVRAAIDGFLRGEDALYRTRVQRQAAIARVGLVALALELTLLAGLFTWHYRRTRRQTVQLLDQQTVLEDQAVELEMQAQEAQEASSLIDMILEGMPNGLAILDGGGRIQRANGALAQLLGVEPHQLVGSDVGTVFGQHGPVVREALDRCAASGVPATNIALEHAAAGRKQPASWLLSIYRADGTRASGTFGCVVVDRSGQAQLERQFIQAQKMEAIGRLAGGVAHDFNNMLLAIGATCELMLAGTAEDDEAQRDLRDVMQIVRRGASLTQQLLAFTRQQVLQPVVLDLNASVREVEPMLRRLIGADIEIRTRLAPALRQVEVDPTQIQQILMNLAVNARDAMPNGGTLVLETGNVELDEAYAREHPPLVPGSYAMLAVSDTGHGMSPDTLARLFEPFFTTKDRGKGTGLGLSTVYGIVRQSGGHVWAYSEPGHGATFKIYLPEYAGAAAPEAPSRAVRPLPRPAVGRLLLVEDDPAVRAAIHRALTSAGYEVFVAENGADALSVARTVTPRIDLVISDVVMPGMGGGTLVTELRRIPHPPRVLLMSGYTHDAALQMSILDADTQFLEKPFTLELLRSRIAEALEVARD